MTILANGTVDIVTGIIFQITDGQSNLRRAAVIEKITFFNTNAAAQTTILSLTERFGTIRTIRQFVLQQNEGGEYLEPGELLTIGYQDALSASTTTASAVDFVIIGERVKDDET